MSDFKLVEDTVYSCDKHGLQKINHVPVDIGITELDGKYCLTCFAEWIKKNLCLLKEIK